MLKYNISYKDY